MHNKIPASQMGAWLLVAAIGPLLCTVGRNGWLTVLLTSLFCGVIVFFAFHFGNGPFPRWLCLLELVWLPIFLSGIAAQSATCWEQENKAIPLTLLFLSAWGAQHGAQRASRGCATLLWLVLPVLGLVLLAGTENINPNWVRCDLQLPDGLTAALLLIPCMAVFQPGICAKKVGWVAPVLGLVAVVASFWMDASLGPSVTETTANAFLEYSKGLTLFGVAERFEALIACVLTGGWFALLAYVFGTVFEIAERLQKGWGKYTVWLCAAISGTLMCILHIPAYFLPVGSLIFWGFLPLLAQGIDARKKGKKSEN